MKAVLTNITLPRITKSGMVGKDSTNYLSY